MNESYNTPAINGMPNPYDIARMIEWAQRINRQWSSRDSLAAEADQWMRHLQKTDPERLYRGAQRAFRLMMDAGRGANLRPPFYRGLLGLATPEELKTFRLSTSLNHPGAATAAVS